MTVLFQTHSGREKETVSSDVRTQAALQARAAPPAGTDYINNLAMSLKCGLVEGRGS
jgi:hypothetical protein